MEPEGSSPYTQVPATFPYPEPTPSSPHNPLPLLNKSNTKQKFWQLDRDVLLILSIAVPIWMPIDGYVTCPTYFSLPD